MPIRGLFLGARGARAEERPAAQGAATGLCLFQSAVRFSPAVCDAGSITKSSWFVGAAVRGWSESRFLDNPLAAFVTAFADKKSNLFHRTYGAPDAFR